MILGLTLFDERFRVHGPLAVSLLLGSMVVAGVAVVVLARAQGRADSGEPVAEAAQA